MGEVPLWGTYRIQGAGRRVQDAGARRVSNAEGMRRMVRKHDCTLPAQYTKNSNARALIRVRVRVRGRWGDYFLRLHTPFFVVG